VRGVFGTHHDRQLNFPHVVRSEDFTHPTSLGRFQLAPVVIEFDLARCGDQLPQADHSQVFTHGLTHGDRLITLLRHVLKINEFFATEFHTNAHRNDS